jgi:hypothetical protein
LATALGGTGAGLQRSVGEAATLSHSASCGEDAAKCLVDRIFGRKRLSYVWLQHDDICLPTILLQVLAPNATFHGGKIILRAQVVVSVLNASLHRIFVPSA